jgi:hypothetical protein
LHRPSTQVASRWEAPLGRGAPARCFGRGRGRPSPRAPREGARLRPRARARGPRPKGPGFGPDRKDEEAPPPGATPVEVKLAASMLRARSHRAVRELRRGFGLGGSGRKAPWWQSDPSSPGFGPGAKGSEPQGASDEQSPGFGPGEARSSPGGGSAGSGTRAKARERRKARPSGGRTRSRPRAKAPELRQAKPPRGRAQRGSRASAEHPRRQAHDVHRLETVPGFGRGPTRRRTERHEQSGFGVRKG